MRPGAFVRFKQGQFGLGEGQNVGIFLERFKEKKVYKVRLFTLKGPQACRAESVKPIPGLHYNGDRGDHSEMMGALKAVVGQGTAAPAPPRGEGAAEGQTGQPLTERRLWELLPRKGEWLDAGEIAAAVFPSSEKGYAKAVSEVLSGSGGGAGYFPERKAGRFRSLTAEEYRKTKAAFAALTGLARLLRPEIFEEGGPVPFGEDAKAGFAAGARAERREKLALGRPPELPEGAAQAWPDLVHILTRIYETGTLAPGEGVGPRGVTAIDGESLRSLVRRLTYDEDAAGEADGIARFLLRYGAWSLEDLVRAFVVRRTRERAPDFSPVFPETVLRAADELAPGDDEGRNRRDLRHLVAYTIDPEDAKDFDDAISLVPGDGYVDLWVHIADVAHYVREGGDLDREAAARATSLYLPFGVWPMLPPRLSEDLCSLRAGVDRLAVSTRLRIDDRTGEVMETEFCESVIRVRANLSYSQVLAWAEEGRGEWRRWIETADLLGRGRSGLNLDTAETRVSVRGSDLASQIKRANAATEMIERFMVATNEAVAQRLHSEGLPIPYRIHDPPSKADWQSFNGKCRALGLDLRILPEGESDEWEEGEIEVGGEPDIDALRALCGGLITLKVAKKAPLGCEREPPQPPTGADEGVQAASEGGSAKGCAADLHAGRTPSVDVKDAPDFEKMAALVAAYARALGSVRALPYQALRDALTLAVLTSLPRARYDPENTGHFGLGSGCYCHFTSPIRRYPDIIVHRQLKSLLAGGGGEVPGLSDTCEHCSVQGEQAERIEWDAKALAMAVDAHLKGLLAGTMKAWVRSIAPTAVFVATESGMEGRIPMREIAPGASPDEAMARVIVNPRFDAASRTERLDAWRALADGEETELLRLGQRVDVRLGQIDLGDGRVAFVLARAHPL